MPQLVKDGNRILVSGNMTVETVNALLAESAVALGGTANIEVDLGGVSEVDSAAVSLLFAWLRQAHACNASLVFVNLPANLASLAMLYGVLDLIPQHAH